MTGVQTCALPILDYLGNQIKDQNDQNRDKVKADYEAANQKALEELRQQGQVTIETQKELADAKKSYEDNQTRLKVAQIGADSAKYKADLSANKNKQKQSDNLDTVLQWSQTVYESFES